MSDLASMTGAWATEVKVAGSIQFSNVKPLKMIAGVNVLESEGLVDEVAERLRTVCDQQGLELVFKASWDKANRSSIHSFRGPGLEQGMRMLDAVRTRYNFPVVTDIHEPWQAEPVSQVCDLIQIPAFLSRQTDLIAAAAKTGKPIMIKKMQMMAPADMHNVLVKCSELGGREVILCERGTSFGYHQLVFDPLGMAELKRFGAPVVFDVTHALQQPGALGPSTGGRGHHAEPLALCGVALGLAGLFVELHPQPRSALCDGPCALPLERLEDFIQKVVSMDRLVKSFYPPAPSE